MMDNVALSALLSVCLSLADLEIVRLNVDGSHTLESVSRHCHLVERFIYECDGERDDLIETSACKEFVLNCPKITTLALMACGLYDYNAHELVKGFHELKYVDFSGTGCITGSFYKNIGSKGGANSLEVIILRECEDLDQVEVKKFMKALLAGKFRRHLDISHTEDLSKFLRSSNILIKQLLEQRPNFCLVAEVHHIYRSDESPITSTSDSSSSTSVSSYNSVSSGDSGESNSVSYEESSDEMDDLPI